MAPAPPLVSTQWLADRLAANNGSNSLRVLDATVWLGPTKSGRPDFEREHIADNEAAFADLIGALADPNSKLFCTNPGPEQFSRAMEDLGVGSETDVVIYDRFDRMWSTRLFWMLSSNGFERASVLDGGFDKWKAEGRPTFSGKGRPFTGKVKFTAKPNKQFWANKDEVFQAAQAPEAGACLINALSPENHSGKDTSYKRPGHIPGAKNVFFKSVLKNDGSYEPVEELKAKFSFVDPNRRTVTYCGGGIAATSDAFILKYLLKVPDVAVFDGSLLEWTADPNAPLVVEADGRL